MVSACLMTLHPSHSLFWVASRSLFLLRLQGFVRSKNCWVFTCALVWMSTLHPKINKCGLYKPTHTSTAHVWTTLKYTNIRDSTEPHVHLLSVDCPAVFCSFILDVDKTATYSEAHSNTQVVIPLPSSKCYNLLQLHLLVLTVQWICVIYMSKFISDLSGTMKWWQQANKYGSQIINITSHVNQLIQWERQKTQTEKE